MTVVAVLGAGALGSAMAERLAESGVRVRLWNRTAQKARDTAENSDNITAVDSAKAAVAGTDAVFTVLRDGAAVHSTVAPLIDDFGHAVWIQVSTVGVESAAELRGLADAHGVAYLDAPVSGSTQPARAGSLIWLVAGADDVLERARPVLQFLGSSIQHVGTANEASALKLAVNAWLVATTVALSDVLGLCDELGLDHALFRDAVRGGSLAMPYALAKAELMERRDYTPGFTVELALKDIELAEQATGSSSALIADARDRLERTVKAGYGREDLGAVDVLRP